MRILLFLLICLAGYSVNGQFKNIKIAEESEDTRFPLDPHISVNNKKPGNIVVALGTGRSIYSLDTGKTWNESIIKSTFGLGGASSLISDAKGEFYYLHRADAGMVGQQNEAWLDRIVCQKSEDGGKVWSNGASIGLNPPKDQDRQQVAVHPRKQIIYAAWTQYDTYGLADPNCQSNILFSMSTNAGGKWDRPAQLSQTSGDCSAGDLSATGAMPAVALDGRIFVAWANKGYIFFDRSYNGGITWLSNDLAIAKQEGGWSFQVPGVKNCNGLPIIAMDNSESRTHGSLYVLYSDQKNGINDTDIWLTRTTSRGDHWTVAARINQDSPGAHQFSPWMTIDQSNGNIFIMYYDRRDHSGLDTDVYIAYSSDGGNTFHEKKVSETPFAPEESKGFDACSGISAHNGVIAAVWSRMDNGKTSVWTAVIKASQLMGK
jgi:hypothetical protein